MKVKIRLLQSTIAANLRRLCGLFSPLIMLLCIVIPSMVYGQGITLKIENKTVLEILQLLKQQSKVNLLYLKEDIVSDKKVSLDVKSEDIKEVLKLVLQDTQMEFVEDSGVFIISSQKAEAKPAVASKSVSKIVQSAVQGVVKDQIGQALAEVTVRTQNAGTATLTNSAGEFVFQQLNKGEVLIFTAIGYEAHTVVWDGQTSIDVILQQSEESLEEVVVVGYGTQKKVNLTGAITSVSSKELDNRPVSDVSNALTGQLAGVSIIQNSGQPGADAGRIRVRGIGTMGNSNAMVIVDGIESSMNAVDANDIENITVLKDAAAAAIYGVRAANGVVLITTKKGKAGTVNVAYNYYFGKQKAIALPKFANSADYAMLYNEALKNDNPQALPAYSDEEIAKFRDGSDPDHYPNSDWLGALLSGNGNLQNHYLNVSGGGEKSSYYVSFGYNDRNGLMANTGFDRYNFRANLDNKITDRFTIQVNLAGSKSNMQQPATGGMGLFATNYRETPVTPIQYSDGTWGIFMNESNSVAFAQDGGVNKSINNRFTGTVTGSYDILDGLSIKGVASYNYHLLENYFFRHRQVFYDFLSKEETKVIRNNVSNTDGKNDELNLQAYLNYDRSFGEHDFKGLLGYSQMVNTYRDLRAARYDLPPNNQLEVLNVGGLEGQSNGGGGYEFALRSVFGRLGYVYSNRYLFEANFRYDGTSRFPKSNRFGLFPSFSAGWRVDQESFMQIEGLSELKLRGSWGKLGNQELLASDGSVLYYPYQNTYVLNQNYSFGGPEAVIGQGVSINPVLANPDITWETTTQSNFGVDGSLWQGKLGFSIDYFVKNTDGILLQFPAPDLMGVNPPTQNAGSVRNAGLETVFSHRHKINEFSYYMNANFSWIKNKITDLAGTDTPGRSVGDPINNIYGLVAEGFFQSVEEIANAPVQQIGPAGSAPGDIRYKDLNGDNVIDLNDRRSLGTYFPEINYGFQGGFQYKGFDFSFNLQGTGRVQGYLSRETSEAFFNGGKVLERHLDRWTPDNTGASYPRLSIKDNTRNNETSSYWMQNAAYLRLRNVQLGYALSDNWLKQVKIKKVRVYVSADNLFTITGFEGSDPEAPYNTRGYYPQVRTITGGVNFIF